MKRGFAIDHTYGGRAVSSWVEGEPERSIWVGVRIRRGTKLFEIESWRCSKCGYLENYAKTEARNAWGY
jgi:hypothetical protein